MDFIVPTHLIGALVALVLGAMVLAMPKGTARHKLLGRIWVVIMLTVSISSFWIRDLTGGFSWIHGLSVFTIFCLIMAIWGIRTGRVATHRGFMIGTFVGLLGAGAGTLAPDRVIGDFLRGLVG